LRQSIYRIVYTEGSKVRRESLGRMTLPSECVSLNRAGFGEIYSSPWSSWRWECGNRLH
jgi:hypothetical protein